LKRNSTPYGPNVAAYGKLCQRTGGGAGWHALLASRHHGRAAVPALACLSFQPVQPGMELDGAQLSGLLPLIVLSFSVTVPVWL